MKSMGDGWGYMGDSSDNNRKLGQASTAGDRDGLQGEGGTEVHLTVDDRGRQAVPGSEALYQGNKLLSGTQDAAYTMTPTFKPGSAPGALDTSGERQDTPNPDLPGDTNVYDDDSGQGLFDATAPAKYGAFPKDPAARGGYTNPVTIT